jgi:rhomboid protease GluP
MQNILVLILIGINSLIFVLPFLGVITENRLVTEYGTNERLFKTREYYRLITSAFVHVDIAHIFFNMYSLFSLSSTFFNFVSYFVADRLLIATYICTYLFTAVVSSVVSARITKSHSIGASGAVFGLFGVVFALSLLTGNWIAVQQLSTVIIINLIFSFMPNSNIDNAGHAGGFGAGLGIGSLLFFIN